MIVTHSLFSLANNKIVLLIAASGQKYGSKMFLNSRNLLNLLFTLDILNNLFNVIHNFTFT